ncbi:MAG TPA: ABC transporter permease, partial [Spirochaetia bacterium]|nr:ABC transporter permease [Spirochaetia bacterium]
AAQAAGIGDFSIIFRHILPNSIAPVIVQSTFQIATAILWAAGLGFLGLGAQAPTPEWGAILSNGREYIRTAHHLTTFPGLAILLMVIGFNLVGDGLRDALDPKTR